MNNEAEYRDEDEVDYEDEAISENAHWRADSVRATSKDDGIALDPASWELYPTGNGV
jgi:hypothetical protein